MLLVGQVGRAAWEPFQAWRARQPHDLPNSLDTWSREVIGRVAEQVGARAIGSNDRPYQPFQRWAMRTEGLKPSPLGILMHPACGLWHAYRGALLFDDMIPVQAPRAEIHLCDACAGRPCLNACPVGAYSAEGFDYAGCQSHLRTPEGQACMSAGCGAQRLSGRGRLPLFSRAAGLPHTELRSSMRDPYDLQRFVAAQEPVWARVSEELRRGRKTSHWMWFMFPQIAGLGMSASSRRYAIRSRDEARAYLAHPVLGHRYRECVETLLTHLAASAHDILGGPDDMKLRSSLTLFGQAAPDEPLFSAALDRFFEGRPDPRTLSLLASAPSSLPPAGRSEQGGTKWPMQAPSGSIWK